jgi:polar amino acid transport system substrate-binding protein
MLFHRISATKKYALDATRFIVALTLGAISLSSVADELADVKASGKLICGTLSDDIPLGYIDQKTNKLVGFDVDLCRGVADEMKLKPEFHPLSVDARIPALQTKRVNIVIASLGYSAERAKQIEFSSAYYQTPETVTVRKDSDIKTFEDLDGKRISVIRSSAPAVFAKQVFTKSEIVSFDDGSSAFMALKQGKVEGMAMSAPAAIRFSTVGGGGTRFLDQNLHLEPVSIGVAKGELAMLAAVNDSLEKLEKAGKLQAIWDTWFGPKTEFKLERTHKLTSIKDLAAQH